MSTGDLNWIANHLIFFAPSNDLYSRSVTICRKSKDREDDID